MSMQIVYRRTRSYPSKKIETIKEILDLFKKYKHVIILSIRDVNTNQMKDLRKRLWKKDAIIRVIKNTLTELAVDRIKDSKPYLQKLKDLLTDMHAIIFTNDDPFELARIADEIKEKRALKPGKISPIDVVIKKGFTGFKPGPEMSEMRMAGLPVRIFDGEVFISQDHVLVQAGQVVSPYAARVMALLDIKPLEVGPKVLGAFVDSSFIEKEILLKPHEEYIKELQKAIFEARSLSIEAQIPLPETISDLLVLSIRQILNLATETGFITTDTLPDLIRALFGEIVSLAMAIQDDLPEIPDDIKHIIQQKPVATKPEKEAEPEKKEEKKPKKKEKTEEESLAGLSLLF